MRADTRSTAVWLLMVSLTFPLTLVLTLVLTFVLTFATGCSDDSASRIDAAGQVDAFQGETPTVSPTAPLVERYAAGLAELDPLIRHQLLANVYAEVTASDIEGMLGVMKEDLRKRRPEEVRVFANLFAKHDKRTALGEVLSWDRPVASVAASEEVMSVWVQAGHSAEIQRTWDELAESADVPASRVLQGEMAMVGAVARYRDYDAMNGLIAKATDADHRRRLIGRAAQIMSQSDGESYLDYAVRVHGSETFEPDVKTELVLQAQKLALLAKPEFATDWYENIKDGPYSGDALSVIAEKWSRTEPVAALEFIRARPASENPDMAKRAAAIMWLKKDPEAAKAYLMDAVEVDRSMDSTLLPLAQYLMIGDPKGAMELAQRVPNAKERDSVLKQGLMRWVQRDEAAAEAYMAENPVSRAIESAVEGAKRLKSKRDAANASANTAGSAK